MTATEFISKFPNQDEINVGCLLDTACPKCGSRGRFDISASVTFLMGDDGEDGHGDIEWGDDSSCSCRECGHGGTVADFTVENLDDALEDAE